MCRRYVNTDEALTAILLLLHSLARSLSQSVSQPIAACWLASCTRSNERPADIKIKDIVIEGGGGNDTTGRFIAF